MSSIPAIRFLAFVCLNASSSLDTAAFAEVCPHSSASAPNPQHSTYLGNAVMMWVLVYLSLIR